MKRPLFLGWYYNEALHGLLEIWKNYILFFGRFFSLRELAVTILSPWHRDVQVRNWRGFSLQKSLNLFLLNIFSRIIGAVIRIFVIALGLVFVASAIVIGFLLGIFWIGAPLIFVWTFVSSYSGKLPPLAVGGVFVFWILISISAYLEDTAIDPMQMEADDFFKSRIFERIVQRLGAVRKRFAKEILENQAQLEEFLKLHDLTLNDYQKIIQWEIGRMQTKAQQKKFWQWENLRRITPIGMQWRYGFTVNLDRYSKDLSQADYSEYSKARLVGRNEEYEVLNLILQRPDQNCALVVGNSGVGKTTLIHELARRIRSNEEIGAGQNSRILSLDLGRAISDAINRGHDVENFLRVLFFEAAYAGNVILVIEHLEHFLGKDGSAFHPDISVVLSEYLNLPQFQIIATSTQKEYHQMIEKEDQIVKYFEVIEMREPSEEESIAILLLQLEKYESKKILFTYQAIKAVVRDSGRYNWQSPLPERAIDLAMDTLMFWEKKSDEQFITEKTVADYLSLKTGVPHGEIEGDERKKLLNLEEILHRQIIGQEEAVRQVAESLRRARSGIANSQKPVGSFLFLGPTGVGKTETAKALAKAYFGSEESMIRLDMSEFQTPSSIDRLLGSSHLGQVGRLVSQIKDKPYSLLLLDEIEKAYPEILDVFLQILDEGYVTDAFGEKINFRNAIIIATSNAGAALIKKMVEENRSADEIKKAVIDHAVENNIFRVEFLNRFEGVIFFKPLSGSELASVAGLELKKFARRLKKEKNIEVEFGSGVLNKVIEKGYDPIFGARSVNRYIKDSVEDIVARKIIAGEVAKGEKVLIDF